MMCSNTHNHQQDYNGTNRHNSSSLVTCNLIQLTHQLQHELELRINIDSVLLISINPEPLCPPPKKP